MILAEDLLEFKTLLLKKASILLSHYGLESTLNPKTSILLSHYGLESTLYLNPSTSNP